MSDLLTQIRDYGRQLDSQARSLADLAPAPTPDVAPVRKDRRGWRYATAAAVAVLVLIGGFALLLREPTPEVDLVAPPATVSAVDELGAVEGLSVAGGTMWAWDREGQVAAYVDGSWKRMPSLADPVTAIAGSRSDTWAVTITRCDPSRPDWERVPCEATLWHLNDGAWEPLPELGGTTMPDNIKDIEVGSTGILLIATADGAVYSWDGREAEVLADAGSMNIDSIAITENGIGDITIWASRFNPFFPEDVGFARLGAGGAWQAFNPLDGQNRHAVMTTTPGGNAWVWFSQTPMSSSLSGEALAFYDSGTAEWTVRELDLPAGFVRAMTATDDSVWLAVTGEAHARLWRFDGEAWTLSVEKAGGEFIDAAAAPDGSVWYVADNTVRRLQP